MSSAFVKEGDDMWLHDIAPTIEALKNYLTRENSGLQIIEKETYFSEILKAQVHKMSDGCYYIIKDNRWISIEE
jgi:hypothetical protein